MKTINYETLYLFEEGEISWYIAQERAKQHVRRRVQSEDVSSTPNQTSFVENTLREIRNKERHGQTLSSHEIDALLGNIRRSRSLSKERRHNRPPPPQCVPPPLPSHIILPFGSPNTGDTTCKQET